MNRYGKEMTYLQNRQRFPTYPEHWIFYK